MANDDRQRDSLETLKLINAASTALRLYPEESAQVTSAIENAYRSTKSFLRQHDLLRFSLRDGEFLLNGEAVHSQTREYLQMLSFNEQLRRMELGELVVTKGFDRKVFQNILSVFRATPEQVEKGGGSRKFVEELGLGKVFPETYVAPGESEEERERKTEVDRTLSELSAGLVKPDSIHFLLGKRRGEREEKAFQESFQSPEGSARLIATATYSLLQILRKGHIVVVSATFSQMFQDISSFLDKGGVSEHKERATEAATLLAPHLDEPSLLMLVCQDFSSTFGEHFYTAMLKQTESETLEHLMEWMDGEQKKAGADVSAPNTPLKAVKEGYERLLDSPRGKQILALGSTRDDLAKTEQGRKSQRLRAGLMALAKGELESLQDEEVCRNLPTAIEQLLVKDKEPVAAGIIQNLVNGLKEKDNELRQSFGQVLGGVAERMAHLERWSWLEKLAPVCLAWIRETKTADRSFEKHVNAMQAMMNQACQSENDSLADQILDVLHQLRSGEMGKPEEMQRIVAHVQAQNVDKAFLQSKVEKCFSSSEGRDLCESITKQGPEAGRFLLDTLILSEKRSDRMRLLKSLKSMGGELVPVLHERLQDPMPWYGKRNILRLIGETGSDEDSAAVLEYVGHEEPRVQQEALQCILNIGGDSMESHLLQVLPGASVQMKTEVVKSLRRVAGPDVVPPLAELLDDCRLYSGVEKEELVQAICHTLGRSGAREAIAVLRKVVDGGRKQFGQEGIEAAEANIAFVERQTRGGEEKPRAEEEYTYAPSLASEAETVGEQEPAGKEYESITDHSEEKEVYTLLGQGEQEKAREKLLQLIEKTVQLKEFVAADNLRLRLIDIDPMRLSEIIKAAEIIEEAKSSAIDKDFLLIWAELFDPLSPEETNALYYALEHQGCEADSTIISQGDPQQRLFLVNKGRVKLFFQGEEDEILIQTLSSGQLFGGASFFDDSVWTFSAMSTEDAEFSTLALASVEEWEEEYPGLKEKVRDFCLREDRINEFFSSSGAERRRYERYALSVPVHIEPADDVDDLSAETIWGDGNDISRGGLSLLSQNIRRKDGKKLLGSSARVLLQDEKDDVQKLNTMGRVVAVRNLHSTDLGYSVHICFEEDLDAETVEELTNES
ncbi:MAG: cyclic nucleotide-binding domain-containing protein [Thermodesulfobacteriota bacterium]